VENVQIAACGDDFEVRVRAEMIVKCDYGLAIDKERMSGST